SNAVAVAGRRSATGQPWVAGDPHLSVGVPSVWLAASYRSPSYRVAGLMAPGVPAMMIGRNPFLAWGGTNLHAASSELFDVSELPAGAIVETRAWLPVRWSRPREIVLRDTDYGPIVSDAPLFPGPAGKMLALRWIGHEPSDEIGALLAINRARDAAEFRRAAESIAVPGQNLVFADAAGHIGRVSAVSLPMRPARAPADLVSPTAAMAAWASRSDAGDFPADIDPPQGFVASANDRPPDGDVPIGWLFSPRDRVERLNALLWASERIGIDGLAALQRDAAAPAMLALRDRLCALLDPPSRHGPVYDALAGWDGAYEPESAGALALELVLAHLVSTTIPPHRRAIYGAVWHARKLLTEEIDRQPPPQLKASLETALAAARPALRRLRDWGGAHRLRLAHPLGALPLVGRRHCHIDWRWPGSNDTVLKSAHGLVWKRHAVSFGSNARYIFDLADPDANRLVILGGQDGAPGSAAFLDQAELFRRGEYLTVPIDPGAMAAQFRHRTVLEP
ncbi:MAG TPA: penicillin acylase family protein, partial [Stellaceae bacterium]|nr:penicillin acylase family protein [Stellaceae bacterium]